MEKVIFADLGNMRYKNAWDLQEKLLKWAVDQKKVNRDHPEQKVAIPHYLLFVEHPHVYTLGKSGNEENVLLTDEQLVEKGIEYFHINRGGDITYHGPGQIVGYPIFDLEAFKPDIHWYLRHLEEAVILLLADYGIAAGRIDGLTGVWLDWEGENPRKILAIGVRCSRWVTMHGFAFNVNTDLDFFGHIVPCGIDDKGVTSLAKEVGHPLDLEVVKEQLKAKLAQLFPFEFKEGSLPEWAFTAE